MDPHYKLSANYGQEKDCAKPVDQDPMDADYNFLDIETQEEGGGMFYILTTKRWAFDKPEELFEIINDFVEKSKMLENGDDN